MVYRRSDTWFTHSGRVSEIEGGYLVGHEVHGPAAIGGGRADRDRLTPQTLGDPQPAAHVACMRKLLVICNALCRDRTMWDPTMA